ncbi:MAG: hypothetical protein ACXWTH_11470, partial [Methylosarcina sp.]
EGAAGFERVGGELAYFLAANRLGTHLENLKSISLWLETQSAQFGLRTVHMLFYSCKPVMDNENLIHAEES